MTEQKDSKWIIDYVEMLIEEVKSVPKEQRDVVSFHQSMASKHQTFFAKYPHLLTMICDQAEDFDLVRLREMLGQRDQIRRGEKNLEDANKEMGQKYFDKYVSPHIDWEKERAARRRAGLDDNVGPDKGDKKGGSKGKKK